MTQPVETDFFPHAADVAVIGSGFAGLAAALPLARARRSVVVFDNGFPRNRFSRASHGFLGQDGRSPEAIRDIGRSEVLKYPAAKIIKADVSLIEGSVDAFRVSTSAGQSLQARRIILANGLRDILPDIPGLAECWGQSVLQCPYCDGFEHADQKTAVLMTGAPSVHQALLIPDWTNDVILLSNGHSLSHEDRARLAQRGIGIVEGAVAKVLHEAGQMRAVKLESGETIERQTLYIVTTVAFYNDVANALGCRILQGPFGPYIEVDALQQTSIEGVYAAGDIARIGANATWAAADGARAGIFAHQSLIVQKNPYAQIKI